MAVYIALFIAGILTILLPCILPLVPIVLGVSIAGRNKLRPLLTIVGMVISFVGFTLLLNVVLRQFIEVADYARIATFYILLLFGFGFVFHERWVLWTGAIVGATFFIGKGWLSVIIAAIIGMIAMELGGKVATRIQQLGTDIQGKARGEFGQDSPLTAFIIGLTLGLVWVPCAGPALGFALAVVREQSIPEAAFALGVYATGTALPLLLVGYGGQYAVRTARSLTKFSGRIKQAAGVLLIVSAIALQSNVFQDLQVWLTESTSFGDVGTRIEEKLFGDTFSDAQNTLSGTSSSSESSVSSDSSDSSNMDLPKLPKIVRAAELSSDGPWHNSQPVTMAGLKGKVVLVDFWTYSCINCIRTLPYIQGYWDKYKDTGKFVLLGVHTPEFAFEKLPENVKTAIAKHGLTYPVVQDNDFGTWNAFSNRYWPAKYLIDAEGYIRYTHFGEGAYEETDLAIASLLKEIGVMASGQGSVLSGQKDSGERMELTPETYLGSRSWPALGNGPRAPTEDVIDYKAPASTQLHTYYLVGKWQLDDGENQVLQSDSGEIRMRFLGGEINMVLGPGSAPIEAESFIDGKSEKKFKIDFEDSYNLFTGEYGEHELVLKLKGKGVRGFAFTFGG